MPDPEALDQWLRLLYALGFLVSAIVTYVFAKGKFAQQRQDQDSRTAEKFKALADKYKELADGLHNADKRIQAEQTSRRATDNELHSKISKVQVDVAGLVAHVEALAESVKEVRGKVFRTTG